MWWLSRAASTDARAQKTAQAFAKILNAAGVNFAVLGRNESCTGDPAQPRGARGYFLRNGIAECRSPQRSENRNGFVATCPHCLHTIKNEYPAFGGNYEVVHHTQFINELVGAGKISLEVSSDQFSVTFHDPCYLGRHNKIFDAPREALKSTGALTIEMPRNSAKSFCCGAGGAQMWKDREESGTARVNQTRFAERESDRRVHACVDVHSAWR
ncbi:MAG: (Fe-S)-binding protein [Anaerolineales bacterium]